MTGVSFVALDFMGDGLYELDPVFSREPRLIAKDLGWLNGMAWGPDGYLYGPIWTKGEVVRIDVDSGNITTVAKGFVIPSSIKFDSSEICTLLIMTKERFLVFTLITVQQWL
jgi:sugar lactone lactonase YvrE